MPTGPRHQDRTRPGEGGCRCERIVLGDRDWEVFFDALANPPKPNAALRKIFVAHRRMISRTAVK